MRNLRTIFIACAMSTTLAAQTTYQRWDMHSGVTTFTTRGTLGTDFGSLNQGVHATTHRGVLEITRKSSIARFEVVIQDQNCASRETFGFVVRLGTDATGPVPPIVLGRISGLQFPMAGPGPCAWIINSTPAPNARIGVFQSAHWDYGVELVAAPSWSTDGQSIHTSFGAGVRPSHNSHSRQHDESWQIVGTATAASHAPYKPAYRMSVFAADGAVMRLRCGGRPGYGGSFPMASTAAAPLAWDARLDAGTNWAGTATGIALSATRTIGVRLGSAADLYVCNPCIIFRGPVADGAGIAVVPIVPFVPASAAGGGTFYVQGAFLKTGGLMLTNCQTVIP